MYFYKKYFSTLHKNKNNLLVPKVENHSFDILLVSGEGMRGAYKLRKISKCLKNLFYPAQLP